MSTRPGPGFSLAAALRAAGWVVLGGLLSGCTNLFFFPQKEQLDDPAKYGVRYQDETLRAADGTLLDAWFFPARDAAPGPDQSPALDTPASGTAAPKPAILYLHGNAENISTHFRSIAWLPAHGYSVLAVDYRGYGASQGLPSLPGAELDIDAAMRSLLAHEGVDPNRIVVFGQSLGGALAISYVAHSAYRANIRAVVIDSSFYDYRQIAREKLASSWLTWPVQWLPWLVVDDDYSPAKSIAAISPLPLLLIHGDKDEVVPLRHSQELFEHAGEPKELWTVPGAGHTQSLGSKQVRDRLVQYLDQYTR